MLAAVVAVISLLFTQLALASYVCPGTAPASTPMAAAAAGMAGMDNCPSMDRAQPSLCHSHDKTEKQSLDKPNVPQVQPFVPAGPAVVVLFLDSPTPPPAPVDNAFLVRATAPPLAIRHCCFRI